MRKILYGLCLFASACAASACMPPPSNFGLFAPNGYGPVDDKFPLVPAVQVESVSIRRATNTSPGMCGHMSFLTVRIKWPQIRAFPIEKMGFYFRVISGKAPPKLFSREPISPVQSGGASTELLFMWYDDPPGKQQPIAFTFEIVPIDPWLHLGPVVQQKVP